MTITEKILARHSGRKEVIPGEFVECKVDIALGNDITAPLAIQAFKNTGAQKVFDKNRVILVPDHFTPNKDIKSAEQCKVLREFARQQNLKYYYEVGRGGIEHALLPQEGLVLPGEVIIGADSHTCTYGALGAFATGVGSTDLGVVMATGECWFKIPETIKFTYRGKLNPWVYGKDLILYTIGNIGVAGALGKAIKFGGEVIDNLSLAERFTICNMAVEAGAVNGIIVPDGKVAEYLHRRAKRNYEFVTEDPDVSFAWEKEYDVSLVQPQVAFPPSPANTKPIDEVKNIRIDQVVIGSCTNGWIEDLRIAAQILKGKKVHPWVRLIVLPATQKIYRQALREGLVNIFIKAGGVVSTPSCGPCLGGHLGVLAKGEKAVATTNRNFVGRMGHPESEVYLTNPAVAAASAVAGEIVGPDKIES